MQLLPMSGPSMHFGGRRRGISTARRGWGSTFGRKTGRRALTFDAHEVRRINIRVVVADSAGRSIQRRRHRLRDYKSLSGSPNFFPAAAAAKTRIRETLSSEPPVPFVRSVPRSRGFSHR